MCDVYYSIISCLNEKLVIDRHREYNIKRKISVRKKFENFNKRGVRKKERRRKTKKLEKKISNLKFNFQLKLVSFYSVFNKISNHG